MFYVCQILAATWSAAAACALWTRTECHGASAMPRVTRHWHPCVPVTGSLTGQWHPCVPVTGLLTGQWQLCVQVTGSPTGQWHPCVCSGRVTFRAVANVCVSNAVL